MIHSAHAVGERRFGPGTRPTQAGRHSRRRCGRIQPHGSQRGGDACATEGASTRADRLSLKEHNGRIVKTTATHASRVWQCRGRAALCN
jgi:hypothetical protein